MSETEPCEAGLPTKGIEAIRKHIFICLTPRPDKRSMPGFMKY